MTWNNKTKIKHLLTEDETHEGVQNAMNAIADVLDRDSAFILFSTTRFRAIPAGDDFFKPVDYAERLLNAMYDYADEHRIWIE